MAEVFRGVYGKKLDDYIAHTREVRDEIEVHTAIIGEHARGLKARHHDTGDSYIETEIEKLDGWVILNDTRGKKAAMAMEFGSAPHDGWPAGTPAQEILHQAAGIPIKNTWPRSRRRKTFYKWSKRRS
jgi:hypothetical protein